MKYRRIKYPDGGVYAVVDDFSNPVIVERINSYEDLFFIKSIKNACDFNQIMNVELIIPCMFQQQHDKRFHDNESFELKLVGDFINSCNFSKVHVFHPHSDVTHMAIDNCRIIDNSIFLQMVLDDIAISRLNINDYTHPILLSTDAGSYKWLNKVADVIDFKGELYGASKSRDIITHKLTQVIDRQDFEGRTILIVDDLCVFGGTFIGLSNLLKERNCGDLYLAISHITVVNPNMELENCFKKIYCTNSKYDHYNLNNIKVFDIQKDLNLY